MKAALGLRTDTESKEFRMLLRDRTTKSGRGIEAGKYRRNKESSK